MQNGGYIEQFLYLLVYSSSIICAAAVVVFHKKLQPPIKHHLSTLIIAFTISCSIISIQVFLNAVGLLERIAEDNASRIIIFINILITAGIAALTYSATSISLSLRPEGLANLTRTIISILIAAIMLNITALQVMTVFMFSSTASELLGIMMIAGIVLFITAMVFSAIRLFIPLKMKGDDPMISGIRTLLSFLLILPVLLILSGSHIGTILAPIGFIGLNILGLRILYLSITHSPQIAGSNDETNNAEPNIIDNCRDLGLSKRETEVAILLSSGNSYKEIAAELFISMSTTQTHVSRIYSKLGVNNKTELSNLLYYKKS